MMRRGSEIVLRAGPYSAALAPEAGGRLTRLSWQGLDDARELIVPFNSDQPFDPFNWPKAGAFAMLPFSNRLAGAKFEWVRRTIHLQQTPGTGYAMHGFGHRKAWQVADTSLSEATLQYRHAAGDAGWPWSFEATQRVRLTQDDVTVNISLTNTSAESMPAGLGWHPFHPLHPLYANRQGIEPGLQVRAQHMHDVGSDGLAVIRPGASGADAIIFDVDTTQPQTTAFEEWRGGVTLPLDQEHEVCIASTGCAHLLLHVPQQPGSICVEPVTLLPGALHHYDSTRSATLVALKPGQTRSMVWRCAVRGHGQPFSRGDTA